jgi:hypothetical protein
MQACGGADHLPVEVVVAVGAAVDVAVAVVAVLVSVGMAVAVAVAVDVAVPVPAVEGSLAGLLSPHATTANGTAAAVMTKRHERMVRFMPGMETPRARLVNEKRPGRLLADPGVVTRGAKRARLAQNRRRGRSAGT